VVPSPLRTYLGHQTSRQGCEPSTTMVMVGRRRSARRCDGELATPLQ
jgi:hypothetical protein